MENFSDVTTKNTPTGKERPMRGGWARAGSAWMRKATREISSPSRATIIKATNASKPAVRVNYRVGTCSDAGPAHFRRTHGRVSRYIMIVPTYRCQNQHRHFYPRA